MHSAVLSTVVQKLQYKTRCIPTGILYYVTAMFFRNVFLVRGRPRFPISDEIGQGPKWQTVAPIRGRPCHLNFSRPMKKLDITLDMTLLCLILDKKQGEIHPEPNHTQPNRWTDVELSFDLVSLPLWSWPWTGNKTKCFSESRNVILAGGRPWQTPKGWSEPPCSWGPFGGIYIHIPLTLYRLNQGVPWYNAWYNFLGTKSCFFGMFSL